MEKSNANISQLSPILLSKNRAKAKHKRHTSPHKSQSKAYIRSDITASTSSNIHLNDQPTEGSVLYRTTSMNAADYLAGKNGKISNNTTPIRQRTEKHGDKMTITTYPASPEHGCYNCTDINNEKRRLAKLLKAVNENLEQNELKEVISLYRQELKAQWTQLAQVIDALLLYMFTTSTFLLLFFLINQAPNAKII